LVNIREDLGMLQRALTRPRPDVVFNLIEHFHDDPKLEMAVANLFELYRLPYTGAPAFALALCQRKGLTKQVLLANGVSTPRFLLLKSPRLPKRLGLRFPLIVKPGREDASSGVDKDSVVFDADMLRARVEKLSAEFPPPLLIEEFIEGRELHVSIFGNDPPVVLPMIEYDFTELPADHPSIISYNAKWNPLDEVFHRVHTECPARLPMRIRQNVEDICLRAYTITGCRDYARVDVRLSRRNHPYVLEVNPNPDLTEGVSFMESAEKAGLSFSQTLRKIVEFALERKPAVKPAVRKKARSG
jgi:D-alanine-D-alanine ligase